MRVVAVGLAKIVFRSSWAKKGKRFQISKIKKKRFTKTFERSIICMIMIDELHRQKTFFVLRKFLIFDLTAQKVGVEAEQAEQRRELGEK